jgi:putative transposase
MSDNDTINESGVLRIPDAIWDNARYRAEVIGPLADRDVVSKVLAIEAANKLNLSERTVYNLIRKWREGRGTIISLISQGSNGGKGRSRLPENIESLISTAIDDSYLTRQKLSVSSLLRLIREKCRKSNLKPPALNTVRSRIKKLQQDKVLMLREGQNAARKLQPIEGQSPSVENPLDIVQIDHTPVDIIVVDTYNRQPIGRPWVTIAIDIYSRCVVGLCLTLESPSATSVGLCLSHVISNKRPWLERIGAEVEWPMFGKPKMIHVDNGSEFHSEALKRGCEVYGIKVSYRPVGSPHYGGIVERVIGTMMKMIHELPGTTFSNITERGEYNSDKTASLTLAELEKWFVLAIASYHLSIHSGIKESPATRWIKVVNLGWQPFHIQNPKNFLIDFLPIVYRRIQRQGFLVDHITYMNSALKPWISERESEKHKFIIRRDPRDLSRIHVLHPKDSQYLEVSYRSIGNPAITLWEHKFAVRRIKEEGRKAVNEEEIIKVVEKMREVTTEAIAKSKSARRNRERLNHIRKNSRVTDVILPPTPSATLATDKAKAIKPFDDIEEW